MALKVWDGFDHYGSATDFTQRSGFLQYITSSIAPSFVTGRNGFGSAISIAGSNFTAVMGQRVASAFIGFACQIPSGSGLYVSFNDTTVGLTVTTQVTVFFDQANFAIKVYRGFAPSATSTQLYISPNNVWTAKVWNFIEIWPVIDDTTGSVTVRVNGVVVATLTGADTDFSGNTWWDSVTFTNPGVGMVATFDDLYYADTVVGPGSYPANNFLGDVRVATLFPTANAGVHFTPLAGTNFSEINEHQMDSDASYNFSTTAGDEDFFTFDPLENTVSKIYGIQLTGAWRKDDGGMRVIDQVVKTGGTEYLSPDHSVPDNFYAYFTDLWILNPNTSVNWTLTDVNNILAGYKLIS